MKNIHVLPTNKPSRVFNTNKGEYYFREHYVPDTIQTCKNYNIYITSDEEIKKGDWFFNGEHVLQASRITDIIIDTEGQWSDIESSKKIILTTDQDLIKEGVQAIDDKFLEWFVKNPSCEEVKVELKPMFPMYKTFKEDINTPPFYGNLKYKIIQVNNYLLAVVNDKKRGWFYCVRRKSFFHDEGEDVLCCNGDLSVEAHLPLNGANIIENLPLLPPLEQEDDVWKHGLEDELNKLPYTKHLDDGQYNDGQLAGFEFGATWGYNKAKEKYKYTEEDIAKAITYGWDLSHYHRLNTEEKLLKMQRDFIKSLSQPKMPIGFECEVRPYTVGEMSKLPLGTRNEKIKTTTNPQGQTVLVGKYIY